MGFLSRGFFFQAEDGIRDWSVTGVQTCALPIWQGVIAGIARYSIAGNTGGFIDDAHLGAGDRQSARVPDYASRSEERRVGKEGRSVRARTPEWKAELRATGTREAAAL